MVQQLFIMAIMSLLGFTGITQSSKKADAIFKAGNFAEAKKEYAQIIAKRPQNLHSLTQLGYISLLQNQLVEAENWLLQALRLKPRDTKINGFLANLYYRRNDFTKAAACFRLVNRESMALKLESFNNTSPYQVTEFDEVRIPFIVTNPLPIIRVKINEQSEGNFILDTGGGELILDEHFAKEMQVETFGKPETGEFGGGKKQSLFHGKITHFEVAGFTVQHLPVNILPLRHIKLDEIKIDGIIGTVFLAQFLSTIDYKNGQLILRNKHKYVHDQQTINAGPSSVIPFSMAEDHYILAKGSIKNSDSLLFFVDTGLSGTSFTCPLSTMKKFNLQVQQEKKAKGTGGGDDYHIYPFRIDIICLGNVCLNNLEGYFGPFPDVLEHAFGFGIDGLISHTFFQNKSLTIDLVNMNLLISE